MAPSCKSFSSSLHTLEVDGFGSSALGLLIVVALLAAWSAWFMLARVSQYVTSEQARLEVDRAPHVLQAGVAGRVSISNLKLGNVVTAGEVLVVLDATLQRLQYEEDVRRLSGLSAQILALHGEQAAEERTLQAETQASHAAMEQARAQLRGADATARFDEEDSKRMAALNAEGLIAPREFLRRSAEAQSSRARAETLDLSLTHLEKDQRTRESEREINLNRIHVHFSQLEAQKMVTEASVERLRYEIERRRIRAQVSGRLGEVAVLRPGSVVSEADRLCTVIPPGTLKVVAEFPPAGALGRIRPGQHARLRLAGFPWAQYGTLPAIVSQVGGEIRDGRVRVDLLLTSNPASSITVQHGLPGALEIEVGRVSPATLVLRSAGQWIAKTAGVPGSEGQ